MVMGVYQNSIKNLDILIGIAIGSITLDWLVSY